MTDAQGIHLHWRRFAQMTKACEAFKIDSCVYAITEGKGKPLYVGSSMALGESRYRGGTAAAIDAALHGSGNLIFVSAVLAERREAVEKALIWAEKPLYNRQGKIISLIPSDAALERVGQFAADAPGTRSRLLDAVRSAATAKGWSLTITVG